MKTEEGKQREDKHDRRLRLKRRTVDETEGRDVEPTGILDELDDERGYA